MVNIERNKKNWEAEFANVTYKQAEEITKDKNIKEISICQKFGVTEGDYSWDLGEMYFEAKINLRAYDENYLKNSNITLIEGRFPKSSDEIIITKPDEGSEYKIPQNIGEKIEIIINGEKKEYEIVGFTEKLEFDERKFFYTEFAAITYFDKEQASDDTIVDVTVLTKNIRKIYDTTRNLAKTFNINEKQKEISEISEQEMLENLFKTERTVENKEVYLKFNTKLLEYACVSEAGTDFANKLYITSGISIFIVSVVSIAVIYTSLKMTYSERIKEYGMLSSIGMNKKQRRKMITKEACILGGLGIIIGIALGTAITWLMTCILNNIIANVVYYSQYPIITIDNNVKLYMKIPIFILLLIITIIYILTYISSFLSMRKINKMSVIEAIRNIENTKVKKKQVKTPKIIEKIFKEEGVLAYKNIRRDKKRYKTIVISLTISIILFLSANGIISNLYKNVKINEYADYTIMTSENCVEDIIKYLNDNNLIDDYYVVEMENTSYLKFTEENITDGMKKIIESGIYDDDTWDNSKKYSVPVNHLRIIGEKYNEILKRAGVTELRDNEVILIDTIDEKTKFDDKIKITNYEIGDSYKLEVKTYRGEMVEEKTEDVTFKVVGILKDFKPYRQNPGTIDYPIIEQVINEETAKNVRVLPYDDASVTIFIKTDKAYEIDEEISDLRVICAEKSSDASGFNTYEIKKANMSEQAITKILIYAFIGLIGLISMLNIFNTISFSVLLRKKEFAILKSIGMSEKQKNKMMMLEGIFYGLDSIIYGILISIVVLYIMYTQMIDTRVYPFELPWGMIACCIIFSYIVIFIAMASARRKIKNKNIIDEVRNENI